MMLHYWKGWKIGVAIAAVVLATGGTPLFAQNTSVDYIETLPDVAERHDGIGRHLGSFWLYSSVEAGTFYDSNVYGVNSAVVDDGGFYVAPRTEVKSDWGRHALNLLLDSKHYVYFDESSQDRSVFNGALDGQLDVRRDLAILGGIRGGIFEDPVGGIYFVDFAAEPTIHNDFEAWSTVNKTFNRLSVSAGGAYKKFDYDDVKSTLGGSIDQDFRDGDSYEIGGRVSYVISEGYRVFSDFRYDWRNYDNSVGESEGWRSLTGVEFELGRLLRGEIGVGYMVQNYDDGGSVGDFSYHAGLVWNPTPLMTMKLDADRVISDSTIADSSGWIEDSIGLGLDYEVLRTLVLSPRIALGHMNYNDSVREGLTLGASVKLDYALNRFLSIGTSYGYTYSDIDDIVPTSGDYDRHVIGIYAKARY